VSLYENVFIARQDVTSAQVDGLIETFEKVISDMGGSMPKKESWGLRTMAYKIKKNRKGHYVLMNIDAPGEAIQEMERQMHLHEDVLRYLTTRVDELDEGPSALLRAKERGDDRDRRSSRDDGPRGKLDAKEQEAKPKTPEAKEETPDDAEPKKAEAKEKTPGDAKPKKTEAKEEAPKDSEAKETPADDDAIKDAGKDEGDTK